MASSKKSNLTDLYQSVAEDVVAILPKHNSILIGLSGGVDSVVLLHLLSRLAAQNAWTVSALHVHHGISPQADHWAEFCREFCTSLSIPLRVEKVDITALRSHGTEAAARKLRYQAFAEQPSNLIALAHHADDQVETLLLQLLRGAGVRGASAMPVNIEYDTGTKIVRPLLSYSRQAIVDYANKQRLSWVEDESNADDYYPRNFLRHRILPTLETKFPAYRNTLARSAQHFSEAACLLDELARDDAQQAIQNGTLDVVILHKLNQPRAKNLLRYFIGLMGAPMPSAAKLDDVLRQLLTARNEAVICVNFGSWQVRRYQGQAYVMPLLRNFDPNIVVSWRGEKTLTWPPLQQKIQFFPAEGEGISINKLQLAPVTLRSRCGGETIRPRENSPTRTLKNLFQESQTPLWQRDRLPLLYCGEKLVCVPNIAIDAEFQATKSDPSIQVLLKGASKN